MAWSPPTVVVDSLTLELAEDKLRQAAAKISGILDAHRAGGVMKFSVAQDIQDQIARVADQLKKMRDGT